mgnify:CR=1 FL=1
MDIFKETKKTLTVSEKKQICDLYISLKKESSMKRLQQPISMVAEKMELLSLSDNRHQRALLNITKALTEVIIKDKKNGEPLERLALIGIAYLCDPFDIIPDHNVGHGYDDDLFMFSLVLADIEKVSERTYYNIKEAYQALSESD